MKEKSLELSPFFVSCERCKKPSGSAGGRYRCQKCGRLVCDPCSDVYALEPAKPGFVGIDSVTAHQLLCRECGAEAVLAEGLVRMTHEPA